MNHSLNGKQRIKVVLGNIIIYSDFYNIKESRDYAFVPLTDGGYSSYTQGTKPVEVFIKGRILKSDSDNPAIQLSTDITNDRRFWFSVDGVYFSASGIKNFSIGRASDLPYYECEIILSCIQISREV